MKIWFVIPAGILLVMLLFILYIWYSPWPAVWLLRHGDDGAVTVSAGFEEQVKGVRVQKDMTYPSQCKRNSFDLYMSAKEEKAPLILWIHGGAFVAGDKSGLVNWGKLLASEGYAVASMNYEWAPEAAWPSQVVQVAECLEELRRLSQQGEALDMENVFLAGDSAGAHIAMQAATAWYSEVFVKEAGILRPLDGKAEALKGILLYCGPYDIEAFTRIEDAKLRFFMNKVGQSYLGERQWQESDRTKYLHIASWITSDCPPVYITDGNSGSFEAQGRRLGDALRRLGVPVSERYFPKEAGEIPHEYQMDLAGPEGAGCISFYHEEGLPEEGYRLEITGERTVIGYGNVKGAYYAMVTLHQAVLQSDGMIPCCRIVDGPALSLRGVLVDISRGKVPRLETLKRLADLLASLKYNHLELYIEGFSYGYRSHPQVWREDACLLAEEVRELADYCRECFIELVPQQNSLGLVQCLFEDLKVSFEPGLSHVGLDEAFEFGKGKNKALLEQGGGERLLVSYIEELHKMLGDEGFRMMMWDDLMSKYPQMVGKVPEDILIMNWGYDREYPVERKAQYLQEAGRRFCLSPGTSSWSSFVGLTDNMLLNIRRTAAAAHKYGAEGMLVTDWGDMNHLQYQPVSYPGFAYGAAWAWNREGMKEEELADALNGFVFADTSGRMGQIALQAGRFYLEEEFRLPCRSLACLPLMFGRISRREYEEKVRWLAESVTFFSPPEVCSAYLESYETRKPFQAKLLYGFLEARLAELDKVRLEGMDGALIVREYRNALKILLYLTQVREEILEGAGSGGYDRLYPEIVEEHESLWMARNKRSGLEDGMRMFERIC